MPIDFGDAVDRPQRRHHALPQLGPERIGPDEPLRADFHAPAFELAVGPGLDPADIRLIGQPLPQLVDIGLIGRNQPDFIGHGEHGSDPRRAPAPAA